VSTPNPFAALWQMGYRRLVPIIPPNAELSPNSALSKNPGCRGKAVGIRGDDGRWKSWNWVKHESTEDDLERWFAMGAGVGVKTGRQPDGTYLIGVDADTLDDRCAAVVSGQMRERFGLPPTRIGKAPKALYVIRTAEELRYTRVEFGDLNERGTLADRVELLAEGRQFVAHGIHPVTMQPYRWVERLVPFHELPIHSAGALA
jgi:hypothetical protein